MDSRIADLRRHARRSGWAVSSVTAVPGKRAKRDLIASRQRGVNEFGLEVWERVEVVVDAFVDDVYAVQLIASRYVRDVRGFANVHALLSEPVPERTSP